MYGVRDLWGVNPEWKKMYTYAMGPPNGVTYQQPINFYTPGAHTAPTVQNDSLAFLHLRQNSAELPALTGGIKFGGDNFKREFQRCSQYTQDPAGCVIKLWNAHAFGN